MSCCCLLLSLVLTTVEFFASGTSEKDGDLFESLTCSVESSILMIKERLSEKWNKTGKTIILTYQGRCDVIVFLGEVFISTGCLYSMCFLSVFLI